MRLPQELFERGWQRRAPGAGDDVRRALGGRGLLTDALGGARPHLALLGQGYVGGWLRRDICISVGGAPWVLAASLLPAALVAQHQWLGTLGGRPLGAALERRLGAVRGAYLYQPSPLDADAPGLPAGPAWMRRYQYSAGGHSVAVMELFGAAALRHLAAARGA